jgi:hypothetical protein
VQNVVRAGVNLKVELQYEAERYLPFVGCRDREAQELPLLPSDREGKGTFGLLV